MHLTAAARVPPAPGAGDKAQVSSALSLTAGRAKKETPMSVKVAASSRPFQVCGYLSP